MTDEMKGHSEPLEFMYEHESEQHLALYSAIGRVIVYWGQLEYHFSSGIMMLWHNYEWDTKEDRPPGQLRRKIKVWRDAFSRHTRLSARAVEAGDWADRLAELANNRDALLHQNWGSALDPKFNGQAKGGGIRARTYGHDLTSGQIDYKSLMDMAVRIERLNGQLLSFTFLISRFQERRG